ncbi:MAG: alpha/beta hydrolase [Clostridiales Family XIII bacterium]|jgi:acetyl esterase/lipase|nr:alpha/beta hydrolase [Clostridiales Family XIII bacterium]
MKDPLFAEYEGAPWLVRTEAEPTAEAEAAIVPHLALLKQYPMQPGVDREFIDDATPEGMVREDVAESGARLFFYRYEGQPPGPRILFYVHGGGFVRGNGKYCRLNARTFLRKLGFPSVACEYRTAPESRWPAALDDVHAAYRYLTGERGYAPSDIILAGESAGGNLAPALLARLKRLGQALPPALILFSPAADLTMRGPSLAANVGKDRFFPGGLGSAEYYCDPAEWKNPEASPYYADFAGFPDTYLAADDTEVLCSDTLAMAARMHAAGVRVKAHLYHGLIHGFPLEVPDVPESDEVYREIKGFFGFG